MARPRSPARGGERRGVSSWLAAVCIRGAIAGGLGCLVALYPAEALATGLNVEQVRLHPEDNGFHGGVQFGVDFQAGNTNRLDLSTSSSLAYRHNRHVAFILGNSQYSTRTRAIEGEDLSTLLDRESRFVNKASLHFRYNYEVTEWFVPEIFTQLESNEFLLVKARVLFGVGPRFVPFKNEDFSLALGTDYMPEYEALDAARVVAPLPAQTLVHRWSSYLSLVYSASERLRMSSTTYIQPRFDRFSDLRLLSEGLLDVLLVEPVSIRLSLRLRWDSEPSVYCSADVGVGGCPKREQIRLREVDISVENAISVRF